ncbi:hypothetical protein LTR08_003779 [Meristemomyces frigidus]|nr:hypothetical protein LTR08_003779 [Meristemomyces frigidus]
MAECGRAMTSACFCEVMVAQDSVQFVKPILGSYDFNMASSEQSVEERILAARKQLYKGFPGKSVKWVLAFARRSSDGACDTLIAMKTPPDIPVYPPENCGDPTCSACRFQYWSSSQQGLDIYAYDRNVTDEEASASLKFLVSSIESNRNWLQKILATHGNLVLSRWTNFTQNKRIQILEQVKGLEPEKWPQLMCYHDLDGTWVEKRKRRNAFLVPHLNVESLAEDKSRVLSLLFSRVQNFPHEFFHMDRGYMELGITSALLKRNYNAKCVSTTAASYGELCDWETTPVHNGERVGYPVAELVLEAQNVTMQALKRIVEQMLPTPLRDPGFSRWQTQGKKGFQFNTEGYGAAILEGPYGPPLSSFGARQANMHIGERLDYYKDAMSTGQCKPDILQSRVNSLFTSEVFSTLSVESKWAWMSFFVYAWHWFAVVAWSYVATSGTALTQGASELNDELRTQGTIPVKSLDKDRLYHFERSLSGAWIVSAKCLSLLLIYTGTSDYWEIEKPTVLMPFGQAVKKSALDTDSGCQALFATDKLRWVLNELTRPEDSGLNLRPLSRGLLLGYLADLLQKPHAYDDLNDDVQMVLLDLMSIWGFWYALRPTTPYYYWISAPYIGIETPAEWYIAKDRGLNASHWREAGLLLQNLLEAPWPKGPKGIQWLAEATEARTRLKKFWDSWREYWRKALTARGGGPQGWTSMFPETQYLMNDLGDTYLDNCVKEETNIKNDVKRKASSQTLNTEPIPFPSGNETSASGQPIERPKKAHKKPKTRSDAVDLPADLDLEPVQATPPSPTLAPILVKSSSLDVFSRMWPAESGELKDGAVRWQQVMSAMTDANCATETNQGSMVNFEWKLDGENTCRIQVHKPHGTSGNKMKAIKLRDMGYRLTEHFLWTWKRFQQRPRGAGEEGA